MSIEVEGKFRVVSLEAVAAQLPACGARPSPEVELEDVYFRHPARDFAATKEALRIRRENGRGHVTYKGPAAARAVKARREIEIALGADPADASGMAEILTSLGFGVVATVAKRRRPFLLRDGGRELTVVLDDVAGLGPFVEIELVVDGPDAVAAAEAAILAVAGRLGLTEREPRSYLEMVLAAAERA